MQQRCLGHDSPIAGSVTAISRQARSVAFDGERCSHASRLVVVVLLALARAVLAVPRGRSPIAYRFTVPEPQHHWMQVEATFPDLAPAPLELRMSRSSPGRYSLHDFAKNVYDVHAFGADGRELPIDAARSVRLDGRRARRHA